MIEQKEKIHGWLILDKPIGLTSTQALGRARRLIGGRKAGHGGTLDPLATGVLPLAFGEATKLIPYVMDGIKEYEFTIIFGEQRTTDDAEGEVVATSPNRPNEDEIKSALINFTGAIMQVPPAFSAIKLDGERAYDIARSGGNPDLAPRAVEIFSLSMTGVKTGESADFKAVCGKGTYIRSLARDLSIFLGTYGYVGRLRRTRVGRFDIRRSISLEKLEEMSHNGLAEEALLAIGAALDDIPGLNLTPSEAQRLRSGQSLLIRPQQVELMQHPLIMAEHQGVPVALVEPVSGEFRVVRGFNF